MIQNLPWCVVVSQRQLQNQVELLKHFILPNPLSKTIMSALIIGQFPKNKYRFSYPLYLN